MVRIGLLLILMVLIPLGRSLSGEIRLQVKKNSPALQVLKMDETDDQSLNFKEAFKLDSEKTLDLSIEELKDSLLELSQPEKQKDKEKFIRELNQNIHKDSFLQTLLEIYKYPKEDSFLGENSPVKINNTEYYLGKNILNNSHLEIQNTVEHAKTEILKNLLKNLLTNDEDDGSFLKMILPASYDHVKKEISCQQDSPFASNFQLGDTIFEMIKIVQMEEKIIKDIPQDEAGMEKAFFLQKYCLLEKFASSFTDNTVQIKNLNSDLKIMKATLTKLGVNVSCNGSATVTAGPSKLNPPASSPMAAAAASVAAGEHLKLQQGPKEEIPPQDSHPEPPVPPQPQPAMSAPPMAPPPARGGGSSMPMMMMLMLNQQNKSRNPNSYQNPYWWLSPFSIYGGLGLGLGLGPGLGFGMGTTSIIF